MPQRWIDTLDLWVKSMRNGLTSLKRKRRAFKYLSFKSLRLRFRLVVSASPGIIGILEGDRSRVVILIARGGNPGTCREAIQKAPKGQQLMARGASPGTSDETARKPLWSPGRATVTIPAGPV